MDNQKQLKFKKRFILGIGWPLPHYQKGTGILIGMQDKMGKELHLAYPLEVPFDDNDCPEYKLILERV